MSDLLPPCQSGPCILPHRDPPVATAERCLTVELLVPAGFTPSYNGKIFPLPLLDWIVRRGYSLFPHSIGSYSLYYSAGEAARLHAAEDVHRGRGVQLPQGRMGQVPGRVVSRSSCLPVQQHNTK
eukprot:1189095-Prorocentrum_minimum.AAC.1